MQPEPLGRSRWSFTANPWPESDCIGVGADLSPATILEAYRHGAFPMPVDGRLMWWSPLRRGVLLVENLQVSRSLRRSARRFRTTVDTAFEEVIDACADPRRPGGWIEPSIRDAYVRLHRLGWAHSIETRTGDGRLVGGLYGLSMGNLFAGESMFHTQTDASKVALMRLVDLMVEHSHRSIIDVQWATEHLVSQGVVEVARADYLKLLKEAVRAPGPASWH